MPLPSFQLPFPDLSIMLGGGGPAPVPVAPAKAAPAARASAGGELVVTELHEIDYELGYMCDIAIVDDTVVIAGGDYGETMFYLSSNGKDLALRQDADTNGIRSLYVDGSRIYRVGEDGLFSWSEDRGETWTAIDTATGGCIYGIDAIGGALWLCGDEGYLAKYERASDSLDVRPTTFDGRFIKLLANGGEGLLVCDDGHVRVMVEGEITADITLDDGSPVCAAHRTSRGTVIVCGDGGQIWRATDARTFARIEIEDLDQDLEAIGPLADGRIAIVGADGVILLSSDDGASWERVKKVPDEHHLWSVMAFGDGALIGGESGVVWKLAPAGDTWWHERENRYPDATSGSTSSDDDEDDDDDDESSGGSGFLAIISKPIPASGSDRMHHLMQLNDECIRAHAAKDYAAAVAIADHAQSVAHENPFIYHSAACAYAAAGDLEKAWGQVKLAVEARYQHLDRVETDTDLGDLLNQQRFKDLFAAYRASPVKKYDIPVDDLELSVRSADCFQRAKIKYVGQIIALTEAQALATIPDFNAKCVAEVNEVLGEMGLGFGLSVGTWTPPRKVEDLVADDDEDDEDYDSEDKDDEDEDFDEDDE
jgi:hypothetical protein